MVLCPISGCNKKFINKYALNNHLRKNDFIHLKYYEDNISIKSCLNCKCKMDNIRVTKTSDGLCWTCHRRANSVVRKEI